MGNKDAWGLGTSSNNAASLDTYAAALASFRLYLGDPVQLIEPALEADPDFALGHILRAHVHISMWERSVMPAVIGELEHLERLAPSLNDRERAHAGAIRSWAAGDWRAFQERLDYLLVDYPRDALALQIGHLTDFYLGDRDNLRTRIERALPHWHRDDPGYACVLGMQAFGLEECGQYGAAESAGRHAIDLEPDDCWAHHAVTHVLEMQARQAEGIAWMESRTANWAQAENGFAFHNWWHNALFNLDQNRQERVLEIYDTGVRPEPAGVQLAMLDAASLLWRLHLRGIDVGNRWNELTDLYEHGEEAGFYAFNDMHAMAAFVATDRQNAAHRLLATAEQAAAAEDSNGSMTRDVGLPVLRALDAFGRGDYETCTKELMRVRFIAHRFGGSHAQRDIIQRTLLEAAQRQGNGSLAQALAAERAALKPHCPFTWSERTRAAANT